MIVIDNLQHKELYIPSFHARRGEGWCLVGTNLSGVDLFCDIIAAPPESAEYDRFEVAPQSGVFTFKLQQELFEEEVRNDDTDFMDRIDPGTQVADFLTDIEQHQDLVELCNLSGSLHKGYRQLSSGQSRKLFLLREITQGGQCLVVQNPYEGVDPESCKDLDALLSTFLDQGKTLVVTLNNASDIPPWCTYLGLFVDGELTLTGKRTEVGPQIEQHLAESAGALTVELQEMAVEQQQVDGAQREVLIELHDGFASYGEHQVFSGQHLEVTRGQHTLITGPNGSGKSTLVQLITGDHPLCYNNDLTLFGVRRGSGESIWDIKQNMGMISPELHRNHYISGSCLQVVISGLFDSIGLYRKPTTAQKELGVKWLNRLGMKHLAKKPFRRLTYAEQRLLLIGRALIKVPLLLILDEPTQGLDQPNRVALLDLLEGIAEEQLCTIVYVSHREDEYRSFFTQHIVMGQGENH
ncbi:MAG: ABC transporter [Desulfobulbus propionicus]|nr:MAG: ABC transporter [Desulfobulbus propionicus]